jgi:hypothetical protein
MSVKRRKALPVIAGLLVQLGLAAFVFSQPS